MALKVKAKEQYQNIGKYAGKYRYVMMPELYTALTQDKVIRHGRLRVTAWHCLDWEPCDSACAPRVWRRSTR